MTDETKKPKRRLGDVVVDKISIVDNPAIGETFKIIKREPPASDPVQKSDAPTHEALLNEKLAGFKTATDAFLASVGDSEKMYEWASKIRSMLWGISDAMEAIPVISAEAGKAVSKAIGQEGICKVLDALVSVKKDDGGKSMEPEKKEDPAPVAKKEEPAAETKPDAGLVAAVSKSVVDMLKAEGIVKAADVPKPEPTAAEKEIATLREANEKLSKRLDDLEKVGVTKTAGGDPAKVVKSDGKGLWEGSALAELDK